MALESRLTAISRRVLMMLKCTTNYPSPHALNREKGLTASEVRQEPRQVRLRLAPSSQPVTSLATHPVFVRAAVRVCFASTRCLILVRHLPVAGRFIQSFCLRWRYGITLRPTAGSGPAACRPTSVPHGRPHGGGGGRLPSSVRCSLPKAALPQLQEYRPKNKQPPAMDGRIRPVSSAAVGYSVRRHKSPAAVLAIIKP
jgi:hypothetical protein